MGKQALNKGRWKCNACGFSTLMQFWYCCHCSASRQTSDLVLLDRQKELRDQEELLTAQLEAVKKKKAAVVASVPAKAPVLIPADKSPYCQSAADGKTSEAAEAVSEKMRVAREEHAMWEAMLASLKGIAGTAAEQQRQSLELKLKETRRVISAEKPIQEQIDIFSKMVSYQSEKLQKAIFREEEARKHHQDTVAHLENRKMRYGEAQELLFAAQKKLSLEKEAEVRKAAPPPAKGGSGPITRDQLILLLAAATTAGGEVLERTKAGLKMLEPILLSHAGGITPPSTPVRKTGRKSPEHMTPTRMAAATAAKAAAEAVEKAEVADKAARDEEMSGQNSQSQKRKAEEFMPLPDPLKKEVLQVHFADTDFDEDGFDTEDIAEEIFSDGDAAGPASEFIALPPTVTDAGQTFLHSFMLQKPGSVSQVGPKTKGWIRRAQLKEVEGSSAANRSERSRSPAQAESSSSGNEDFFKRAGPITPPSEDNAIVKSGFGAACVTPIAA